MRKTGRLGEKEERYFYNALLPILPGLKPTPNSGARFGNGDMTTPYLLIDVKSTIAKGIPGVSEEDWGKIQYQAESVGKDFIIPLKNSKGDIAFIFPEKLGMDALRLLFAETKTDEKPGSKHCPEGS